MAAVAVASLVVWGAMVGWRWLWPAGELLTINEARRRNHHRPRAAVWHARLGLFDDPAQPATGAARRNGRCRLRLQRLHWRLRPDRGLADERAARRAAPRSIGGRGPAGRHVHARRSPSPRAAASSGRWTSCAAHLGSTSQPHSRVGSPSTCATRADAGYTFSQFTGDARRTARSTMTAATDVQRHVHADHERAVANVQAFRVARACRVDWVFATETSGSRTRVLRSTAAAAASGASGAARAEPTGTSAPSGVPPVVEPTANGPRQTAAAPITAEEHAKKEIDQLVKNYCAALDTLKPEKVREWFPLAPQGRAARAVQTVQIAEVHADRPARVRAAGRQRRRAAPRSSVEHETGASR